MTGSLCVGNSVAGASLPQCVGSILTVMVAPHLSTPLPSLLPPLSAGAGLGGRDPELDSSHPHLLRCSLGSSAWDVGDGNMAMSWYHPDPHP